ncbi:hypothetical protein HQN64_20485 [Enterobacteriaceae bacterium BIT-l23]|uniref:hypothetical protein n=1 Tax=Jejubacter sp. L23 TaxID=3092086 RepID=UPI001584B944|nr:hypothetical protein [Enterobacteriaceae bacterium BIT-l23]
MSKKEPKLISFDEFAEYLNGLKGEHICPMCEEEKWTLYTPKELEDQSNNRRMQPTIPFATYSSKDGKEKGNLLGGSVLDVLIMECQNCGYMNFFSYAKVLKNISNSEEKESDSSRQGEDDESPGN